MLFEADVPLSKDSKETTKCGLTLSCIRPILVDVTKARSGNLDERSLTPIQILDIIFRQNLGCPLTE